MGTAAAEKESGVHTDLLASLLFRYPEICTIKLIPKTGAMALVFAFHGEITRPQFLELKKQMADSLSALSQLRGGRVRKLKIDYTSAQGYTTLEVIRDIASLERQEISVLVELVKSQESLTLLMDELEIPALVEDIAWHDELIENMLEDMRERRRLENIVGFRDAGRVLVFSRAKGSWLHGKTR